MVLNTFIGIYIGEKVRKKFIYVGIVLIIVAFALLIVASSMLSSTIGSLFTEKNLTVGSAAFSYLQVPLSNQSAIVAMASHAPVNFYIFNYTGFSMWSSTVYSGNAPSGYSTALSLEGAGLLYGYKNAVSATVPYTSSIDNVTPFYQTNVTPLSAANSTYYAVVDNTNGSASSAERINATILYQSKPSSLTQGQTASALGVLAAGVGFFILLIAGIVLIIYGLVKKQPQVPGMPAPQQKGNMSEEQIDQLYKDIKKKSGKKGKGMQTKAE